MLDGPEPFLERGDRLVDLPQTDVRLAQHLIVLRQLLPLVGEQQLLDRLRVLLVLEKVHGEVTVVKDLRLLAGLFPGCRSAWIGSRPAVWIRRPGTGSSSIRPDIPEGPEIRQHLLLRLPGSIAARGRDRAGAAARPLRGGRPRRGGGG